MSLATTDLSSAGPERDAACGAVDRALRAALGPLSLEEGYDWTHIDNSGTGRLSIVLLRSEQAVTETLLCAVARSLAGLDWELFLAIDSSVGDVPTPITMVNRYALSPMPKTPPHIAELMSTVSKRLFAEYPSE